MTALLFIFIGLFILVCLILTLIILIQKGRGGGLSGAFGGAGGNTAFGSKTGDVLTWATSIIFGIFLLLAIALSLVADRVAHPATPPSASSTTPAAPAAPTAPGQS